MNQRCVDFIKFLFKLQYTDQIKNTNHNKVKSFAEYRDACLFECPLYREMMRA